MFELYKDIGSNSWTKIDVSNQEKDIVDTLMFEFKRDNLSKYKIKYDIGDGEQTFTIRDANDYHEYVANFQNRMLQQMSCVELKREMLDIVFAKTKKM